MYNRMVSVYNRLVKHCSDHWSVVLTFDLKCLFSSLNMYTLGLLELGEAL